MRPTDNSRQTKSAIELSVSKKQRTLSETNNLNNSNFPFGYLSSKHTAWMFFLPTIDYSLPWRTIFCSEKINLKILSFRHFLSYLEAGRFFRNLKEIWKSKIIGPRVWQYFCLQLWRAKEDVMQNSVIVHEINKGNIEWWIISLQIFEKDVIS